MARDAWEQAGRLLERRSRSARELREALRSRGFDAQSIEETLERLQARGWLDDERLARDFVVERVKRGHGRERVLADLGRRGVSSDLARAAWDQAVASGAVDPEARLDQELARRLRGRDVLDPREARRIHAALARAGFDGAAIRRGLAPHLDPALSAEGDLDG